MRSIMDATKTRVLGLIARLLSFRERRSLAVEDGQVLILVALSATVLMGFLALSVDIGNLYFARRAAQNAADISALVGAQNKQGTIPNVIIVQNDAVRDAHRYAIENGYDTNSGASNHVWNQEVRVDVPPETGPFANQPDYIEVRIRRNLPTLFAGVLGVDLDVSARAVARARRLGLEMAILALDTGDPALWVNGGSRVGIVGSTYSRGTTQNMSGVLNVSEYAYADRFDGTVVAGEGLITDAPDMPDPAWPPCGGAPIITTPGVSWNSTGIPERATTDVYGYEWIDPGTYDWISIRASDKVKFRAGVYHVTESQGVVINGDAISAGPVCFYMDAGTVFNAAGTGQMALYSGLEFNNILIWSADSSTNAVKIAGGMSLVPGSTAPLAGTIYVPYGTVRLGGSSTGSVRGQVVANDIALEGGNGTAVVYDPNFAAGIPGPALVE